MTYEEIAKVSLEELKARKEEVEMRLFRLEMADRLVGEEYRKWKELSNEKLWLIGEVRNRTQANQA